MAFIAPFLLLVWVCAVSVVADFSMISEVAYNHTSVERVFFTSIDGYYLALLMEPKAEDESGHSYSVLVFELLNGTLTQRSSSTRNSQSFNTPNVQFIAQTSQSIPGSRYFIETLLCSIYSCVKLIVFDEQGVSLSTEYAVDFCGTKPTAIVATLWALNLSPEPTIYVHTQNNEIYATICDNPAMKQVRLSCSDSERTFNNMRNGFISKSGNNVKIFGLLANGDTTAICVFSFGLSSIDSGRITNITEQNKMVLSGTTEAAIGMTIADAEQDHFAYVIHTDGLIAKVSLSFVKS